jgi:hypothetical protein
MQIKKIVLCDNKNHNVNSNDDCNACVNERF